MKAQALAKINTEINASNNNPFIKVVGEFLLSHIESNPGDSEKILTADKTISKSLEAMKKVAEKRKVGNMAILTDAEGFKVVLEYFGIKANAIAAPITPAAKPKADSGFEVNLDDLLSGV